jgi:hypothetical protein
MAFWKGDVPPWAILSRDVLSHFVARRFVARHFVAQRFAAVPDILVNPERNTLFFLTGDL